MGQLFFIRGAQFRKRSRTAEGQMITFSAPDSQLRELQQVECLAGEMLTITVAVTPKEKT